MSAIAITGTLKDVTDNFANVSAKFISEDTPNPDGNILVIQTKKQVVTDSSGALSLTLYSGRYTVELSNGESFIIDVPGSGGPYSIEDLVVEDAAAVTSSSGAGSPEGVVTGNPGDIYWQTSNKTLWVKNSGTGNTGWQDVITLEP